jgi:hypothetical protein
VPCRRERRGAARGIGANGRHRSTHQPGPRRRSRLHGNHAAVRRHAANHTDALGSAGDVLETVTERKTGWHLGLGAEIFVARKAALFADYRWRFVRFGEPADDEESIDIPVVGDNVKLSHRGSMWSGGLAFYF